MQREPSFFNGQVSPTDAYGVGGSTCNTEFGGHYAYGAPATPAFGAALAGNNHDFLPSPLKGLEFQAMDTCPQNYIIFDQTENKSRVMFHPALARELNCHYDFNNCANNVNDGGSTPEKNGENRDDLSPLKENTADIDALLSSDEDEDDDMVSTGRSPANWAGSSPDYSSSDEEWKSASSHKSFSSCAGGASSSSSDNRRKRERVRKMVKVLRGIIPGGEGMGTPAVLDEAVKYLKSLKIEVKKLGIQNFDDY
ncbi:putative transcription factor bHLH144 [Iris pallida]|uniref:Transcription factor bHLH144 n=1 Tax=Iris pallida TaxID=29817 RepID=A0AAX6HP65_IRIPA|nr:putative transcription factor bHLH144 [Iris pallida]